jgi:hypothetical protein
MRSVQHWARILIAIGMGAAQTNFVIGYANSPLKTGRKQFKVNNEALAKIENMMGEFEEYRHMVKQTETNLAAGDANPGMYSRSNYENAKVAVAELNLAHELKYSQLGQDNNDETLKDYPNFTTEVTEMTMKANAHTKTKN